EHRGAPVPGLRGRWPDPEAPAAEPGGEIGGGYGESLGGGYPGPRRRARHGGSSVLRPPDSNGGTRSEAPATSHQRNEGGPRRGWATAFIWSEPHGRLPPRRRLCGQDPQ